MIALRRLFQISRSNIGLMKAHFCCFLSLSVRQPCQGIVWQVGTIHHPINISFIAGDPGWQTEQRRAVGSWQINHRFPSCSFIPSLNSRAADTMQTLCSDWSIQVTWPEHCALIGSWHLNTARVSWSQGLHSFSPECPSTGLHLKQLRTLSPLSTNQRPVFRPRDLNWPIRGRGVIAVYEWPETTSDQAINCKQRRDQGPSCLSGRYNEPWNAAL